jgi:hypothetical protein
MSPFGMNTSLKPLPPLSDRRVNEALLQTTPNFHQTLLQFVNTVQSSLVDMLLHDPQILWSTGFRSELLGGHSSGEMKSGVSRCSNWMVSRAWCAGALSC